MHTLRISNLHLLKWNRVILDYSDSKLKTNTKSGSSKANATKCLRSSQKIAFVEVEDYLSTGDMYDLCDIVDIPTSSLNKCLYQGSCSI